jgi:hypothetical protein
MEELYYYKTWYAKKKENKVVDGWIIGLNRERKTKWIYVRSKQISN